MTGSVLSSTRERGLDSDEEDSADGGTSPPASDTESDVMSLATSNTQKSGRVPKQWRSVQWRSSGFLYKCVSRNHAVFLRDQVYTQRCSELHVHVNSGVRSLLTKCSGCMCFCNLEVVSFRDYMLGDRGLLALLPLLTFARTLRCLSLAGNGMREASLRQLVALLLEPSALLNLSALDLSHNPLVSSCESWLLQFLPKRPNLLLIGLAGTNMPAASRQRLLRQVLAGFGAAEPQDMYEAWKLGKDDVRFADRELWVRCTPLVEMHFDRDVLDRVDPYIKADSVTVLSASENDDLNFFISRLRDGRLTSMRTPSASAVTASEWEGVGPSSLSSLGPLASPEPKRTAHMVPGAPPVLTAYDSSSITGMLRPESIPEDIEGSG